MEDAPLPDAQFLVDLVSIKMPFGKYKGTVLSKLPVSYLEWFARNGFPKSKLGMQLQAVLEIKMNGLEHLFPRV